MNILVLDTHSFGQDDVITLLKESGHNVYTYGHPDLYMHKNDTVLNEIRETVNKHNISIVFSFNYFPIASYALKETNVKYISYVYDSPHIALYTCSIVFPCNYVFIFDYAVYEELKNGGITTVYYLPLSVNINRINKIVDSIENQNHNFLHDITFVGGLYNEDHNLYDRLINKLGDKYEYIHGYLDGLVNTQSKVYGYFFLEKMLDNDTLKILDEVYPYESNSDSIATPAYAYAHYFMARKSTEIERIRLLNKISEKYNLSLFTYGNTSVIPNAKNHGTTDYYNSMPLVFNKSKININISLKSILTGIPLRCIDIMASGGFLLTNYQADLFRHFEPGKHFDYFTDDNDLINKIEYYLNHEEERMTIAANAKKEIETNFNLKQYLNDLISAVCDN